MAGFFGFFDFTKPGKGVDADAPVKRAPIRFFELLWRNLWRFIKLNFVYFLMVLPLLLLFHIALFDPLIHYSFEVDGAIIESLSPMLMLFSGLFQLPEPIVILLLVLSALCLGPLTCGLTYCLRNAVRQEHFWFTDLFQRAWMNLKVGLQLGILDVTMLTLGGFNLRLLFLGETEGAIQILTILSILALLFYLGMRNTLYLMAVTFELSFGQLIRNALLLTLAGLPRHLLIGLLHAVLFLLIFLLSGVAEIIAMVLVGYALFGYTSVFIAYPLVEKHLLRPLTEPQESDAASESEL